MRNDLFLKEMGRKIKSARLSKKITQQQLADMCKIDRSGLSFIETGISNAHLLTLKLISDKLDVDIKDFL